MLIKLNQTGTVSETLDAIRLTQEAGWQPIVSARSGETENAFISHLAVATNAGQLKVGSFNRSERTVKWNEVVRIERELGERARCEAPATMYPSASSRRRLRARVNPAFLTVRARGRGSPARAPSND